LAQFHCSWAVGIFCCSQVSKALLNWVGYKVSGIDILNLVLIHVRNPVDNDPRQRSTKVDNLMHDKGHDTCGENIVLHECIPRCPHSLGEAKMEVVFRDLLELAPICIRGRVENNIGRIPGAY
jgi:hypothetical protein